MTTHFWKEGEKLTQRELDSYWNGREEEQDRIIDLLKNLMKSRSDDWQLAGKGYTFEYLISLVKGEK